MLRRLAKDFELIVFTSSDKEYATSAINAIESHETFF
jgi:TFIIF-interacting CTD phosphatase-like protein